MRSARLILAAAVIAAAFAAAVYIHQRESVAGSRPATDVNIFDRHAAERRSAWQDPVAVIVAVAGLASAALIVRARH